MEVTIQHKEEKPLLHRTDVRARVAYEGATPQRTQLRDKLESELKTTAKNVIVRRIATEFGNQAVVVEASVYKDEQALEQYEPGHMKKRHGLDKKEDAAAAAEGQ